MQGVFLEDLTWLEAEVVLTKDAVVVIPIGAAAKEHGPHLRLNNDWRLARYFAQRLCEHATVVIAPILGYHHYPAFVEYPGSISLRMETARDLLVDICLSLARFGPRRFYALNTGVSTVRALAPAKEVLFQEGILFHYTRLLELLGPIEREVGEQEGGTHADETETSLMLHIDPSAVDMAKAVRDYDPLGKGRLTRSPDGGGVYSPTGIFGDPTLAKKEKGTRIAEALLQGILKDVESLRGA